jgi:ferredoxin-thioredoxin reductase catalytic subunit
LTTVEDVKNRAESDAKTHGYYLTPDKELLQNLLDGLQKNEKRYGYPSCPCRLGSGNIEIDRDIICPCDYRDPDVAEFGQCYCALYVSKDVFEGKKPLHPIPERRPTEKQAIAHTTPLESFGQKPKEKTAVKTENKKKLWYCKQCGYICYREEPPYMCPVCKAKKELFAELTLTTESGNSKHRKICSFPFTCLCTVP